MIRAYHLSTGPDGNSHVRRGQIEPSAIIAAKSIQFKEDPPHSSLDWHQDPEPRFVLFLAGALEFTVKSGDTFTVQPGEVLIAVDNTGTGHKWQLVNEQPWIRAYVVFEPEVELHFLPDAS